MTTINRNHHDSEHTNRIENTSIAYGDTRGDPKAAGEDGAAGGVDPRHGYGLTFDPLGWGEGWIGGGGGGFGPVTTQSPI